MSTIIGKGDSEGLRRVEKDVIITKKVKKRSRELCANVIKEFEDCVRGRTVSAAWKCRAETKKMNECLVHHYQDASLYDQCKVEYLAEREEFRRTGIAKSKMKRASS